jgi:23S rRNA (adenine2503-C2)-methyltransferase
MNNFFDLQAGDLEPILNELSQPGFRSNQIWEGVYNQLITTWQEFSNLPKDLRDYLEDNYYLNTLQLVDEISSMDHLSTKFLFKLLDGNFIESVILRNNDRITLCISTQSGCPVGCVFCATGKFGFHRNLSSGEIIEQVVVLARLLKKSNETITNIVIMGMGEPLLNYEATLTAIKRFNDKNGLNFGARRITLSTIGIPEKIIQFANEGLQVNLAVSLHAPNDNLRQELVPIAEKVPINDIIQACRLYIEATSRRVTFEYVLIDGINDQPQYAEELAALLKGLLCHVNLIGLNPTTHYHGKAPRMKSMTEFGRILIANHIPTSIRNSQGSDIQAACGQLAGKLVQSKSQTR